MIEVTKSYSKIDSVIKSVSLNIIEPYFTMETKKRNNRIKENKNILRTFAIMICFSQNAKSSPVERMINSGLLDSAFKDFTLEEVVIMNPEEIIKNNWSLGLSVIRFPSKIFSIIKCAQSLLKINNDIGSFKNLLSKSKIPEKLRTEDDVKKFWEGFDYLRTELKRFEMPFFTNVTTLLHLLLDLGYECVKPDLIVMRVAKGLGIVDNEKGEKNLVRVVKTLQLYSLNKNLSPAVLDLYFMIYGGQSWAKQFVYPSYY
jgi:3-methyladenine DNA glycosylase Tag